MKERINLVFIGQWHGIHRTIPIEYPGPRGTNYTLFLDVTAVTDGAGQKLKYESKTSGNYRDLKIYIPDAVDTTRTVEIDYIVRNGIRYFEDHDEFYWNVTGNDWPVPIDHAEAHVYLPENAAGKLRAQAFTGAYGSAQRDATSEINGADVAFETTNPLPMRGGMTIDIFIPKGIVKEPGAIRAGILVSGQQSHCVSAVRYFGRDVRAVVVQRARSRSWAIGCAHVRTAAGHVTGRGRRAD